MTRARREFEEEADPYVVIGFDAEWVFKREGKNRVLSYQFAVLNADTDQMTKLIHYPKGGRRITLEKGLSRALIKARQEHVIDRTPRRLVIAAHFTRADLTTFEDFGLFKRRIDAVRKSYATATMPLMLDTASPEGPVRCGVMIADSMMLTSAGTSADAIGKLLGVPKVELPEGYSKDRMDLFLKDHPELFEKYALTDAEIPARWVARTHGLLLDRLGIAKKVITLGGAAVELTRREAKHKGIELDKFLGHDKPGRPFAHLVPLIAIAAQAYHGGFNVATALGFSPEDKELVDLDIRAAYSTALSLIGVPDWHNVRPSTELSDLAVITPAMTVALVEFCFPDATSYPCLPIRASDDRGLIYPLQGQSWCTGPELVVARGLGADIVVRQGYRVDWIEGSIRLFEAIARQIGKIRHEAKAQNDKVLDKTVKELVNSIYGKIAQSIAGTKIIPDDRNGRRVFDTKFDASDNLGPSAITNAPMAAYCTGLVRALLLETIGRLPKGTWIGTATTDGFLSTCKLDDIDQTGPLAMAFRAARRRITPDDDTIWEVKHVIPRALVTKTRGTYTVAPSGWNGEAVLAKAGYMTPEEVRGLTEIEQCRFWIEKYRERNYETMLRLKSLTPLRLQHLYGVDLQAVETDVRWNADCDMKRKLVKIHDVDGLITADTIPWRTLEEFEQARNMLEGWKKSRQRVLKTTQDYEDMMSWDAARDGRRATGTRDSPNALPPTAAAVLKLMAHRHTGTVEVLEGQIWRKVDRPRLNARAAKLMSGLCGVRVTEMGLKNTRRRGAEPLDLAYSITALTDEDRRFLTAWLGLYPVNPEVLDVAELICAEGSPAAAELEDLFLDAMTDDDDTEQVPDEG